MLKQVDPENKWYKEGVRFECTGCGACCTGSPGFVWVDEGEIEQMAGHVGVSIEHFVARYVRQVGDKLSLKELMPSYDCVFLKDKKCSLYEARPRQCRTFPFWPKVMESRESWSRAASYCEGMSEKAPLIQVPKNFG